MEIKTQVKASGSLNHNLTLRVKSRLKAGDVPQNHNQTLRVKSNLKSGG